MSRATILFYKDNFVYPIFKKVFGAKGLSKTEFTAFLFSKAKKICKENNFDSFSIIERIDTIEMTREERKKIKDFIFNVLQIFQHQEEFLADESGLDNFQNPMFDKAMEYILGIKK